MYTLRPYQQAALESARRAFASGKPRSLIVAPTGSGKTVIACALVESAVKQGSRTLFLAHRIELIEQASRKLTECGIDHGIIKAGIHPSRIKPEALVQVAAVQTLDRRLDTLDKFRVVIVDEAHHAKADSWTRVIEATQYQALLGLTATPYRADGKALGDHFDELIVVASLEELIKEKHLVEPRVFGHSNPDLKGVERVGNDYNQRQLARVMDRPDLVEAIVVEWKRWADGRTTVVFATSVNHSVHIAEAFNSAGIPAGHIDSEMAADERAAVLDRLARGELAVVSNCQILTEGWDLPRCAAVVLARPTQSRSLWKQMCGRALRPCPEVGKEDCFILDHAGCWKRHGFLTDPETPSLEGREPRESEAPTFACRFCGAEFKGRPRFCPECQEELPIEQDEPALATVSEEPLVEVGPIRDPQRFFLDLLRAARDAGREPTFATGRFRGQMGDWPPRSYYPTEGDLQLDWDTSGAKRRIVWKIPLEQQAAPGPKASHNAGGSALVQPDGSQIREAIKNLVSCPDPMCGAPTGRPCVDERGAPRKANHQPRVTVANEVALWAACPACRAAAHTACVGDFGTQKNAHADRLRAALTVPLPPA